MCYYPLNKEKRTKDFVPPNNSRIYKSNFAGNVYLLEIDFDLLPKELSIEHITPYLDSDDPKKLFFDLNNIAFSHLKCNSGAARQTKKTKHPSWHSYKKVCRCNECKKINADRVFRYRNKLN